jgi:hypothetical protein
MAFGCGSWASAAATAGLVPPPEVVLQTAMVAQAEQMQGYMARIGRFLERAEAAMSKLSLLPATMETTPSSYPHGQFAVGSEEDMGAKHYGCFFPRAGDSSLSFPASPFVLSTTEGGAIDATLTPMLEIMPELRELCVSPTLPLSAKHMKVNSSVIVSSSKQANVELVPIPPSPTHNSDALVAKELCDLLSRLDILIPGFGRAIACLLTGMEIKGKSNKVGDCRQTGTRKDKSLRCKDNKSGDTGKASAAA